MKLWRISFYWVPKVQSSFCLPKLSGQRTGYYINTIPIPSCPEITETAGAPAVFSCVWEAPAFKAAGNDKFVSAGFDLPLDSRLARESCVRILAERYSSSRDCTLDEASFTFLRAYPMTEVTDSAR